MNQIMHIFNRFSLLGWELLSFLVCFSTIFILIYNRVYFGQYSLLLLPVIPIFFTIFAIGKRASKLFIVTNVLLFILFICLVLAGMHVPSRGNPWS